jgi:hypothetical protein
MGVIRDGENVVGGAMLQGRRWAAAHQRSARRLAQHVCHSASPLRRLSACDTSHRPRSGCERVGPHTAGRDEAARRTVRLSTRCGRPSVGLALVIASARSEVVPRATRPCVARALAPDGNGGSRVCDRDLAVVAIRLGIAGGRLVRGSCRSIREAHLGRPRQPAVSRASKPRIPAGSAGSTFAAPRAEEGPRAAKADPGAAAS